MTYYFIKEGEGEREAGPYTLKQLKNIPITQYTLIWHAGIKKWYLAGNIYELKNLFEKKLSFHGFAKNKLKKILGIKAINPSLKKVS